MLAISSLVCKQLHNYPDCLRPFLRGFRFLSSTNCDPCSWLRPSAYPKDSRRIPQKTSGTAVSHNIKQPFEKSRNILIIPYLKSCEHEEPPLHFTSYFPLGSQLLGLFYTCVLQLFFYFFIKVLIFSCLCSMLENIMPKNECISCMTRKKTVFTWATFIVYR